MGQRATSRDSLQCYAKGYMIVSSTPGGFARLGFAGVVWSPC